MTRLALAAVSVIAAVATVVVAVYLVASGGERTEDASAFRSSRMVVYPMPPTKAAIAAGIGTYSLDALSGDASPFVIGNVPPGLSEAKQASRFSADDVVTTSGEPVEAFDAGEKGADG